jgi:hypothetical protein
VDSTAYVRTFIEAPYRSAEAARKIALSSCRSRDLFIGCEFLVTWNVAGRPTSAPNLERMEDIFCGGSPAPASSRNGRICLCHRPQSCRDLDNNRVTSKALQHRPAVKPHDHRRKILQCAPVMGQRPSQRRLPIRLREKQRNVSFATSLGLRMIVMKQNITITVAYLHV